MNFLQGFGAGIGGLLEGYQGSVDRDMARQKLEEEQQYKQAILAIQQAQEADRVKQKLLEDEARTSVANLMQKGIKQDAPIQSGLLSDVLPKQQGISLVDPATLRQPIVEVTKPAGFNDYMASAAQYAGTPAAKTATDMAGTLNKNQMSEEKLANLKEMLVMRQDMQQKMAEAKNEVEREKIKAVYDAKILGYENALKMKSMPSIIVHAGGGQNAKPMPASAVKLQNDELDIIGAAKGINADLGGIKQQLDAGTLNLGVVANVKNKARNALGLSTEQSRNLESFMTTLEAQRNASLRLNKGVQTEGDAQRAWNELFKNISDPKIVGQRIAEITALNERAATLRKNNVNTIRNNYGQSEFDFTPYENVKGATNVNKPLRGQPSVEAAARLVQKYGSKEAAMEAWSRGER